MDLWSVGGGRLGQSVMKLIWCSGLPEMHARLWGGPSAKYELTLKFTLYETYLV